VPRRAIDFRVRTHALLLLLLLLLLLMPQKHYHIAYLVLFIRNPPLIHRSRACYFHAVVNWHSNSKKSFSFCFAPEVKNTTIYAYRKVARDRHAICQLQG
jgi:hypothetical protein